MRAERGLVLTALPDRISWAEWASTFRRSHWSTSLITSGNALMTPSKYACQ
jgi:hypothetical protein